MPDLRKSPRKPTPPKADMTNLLEAVDIALTDGRWQEAIAYSLYAIAIGLQRR